MIVLEATINRRSIEGQDRNASNIASYTMQKKINISHTPVPPPFVTLQVMLYIFNGLTSYAL